MPVDWVAEALVFLLFKPTLRHRRYHVSAGEASSVTWQEIASVFARCYGDRPDNPYQVVDIPTILRERDRARALLGPGDDDHLFAALPLYYRFMEIEAEIFQFAHSGGGHGGFPQVDELFGVVRGAPGRPKRVRSNAG